MIITMYVMPSFTYPSLSLCSHGVIIVLCDLQILLFPINRDVTRVHYATTLETGTSDALMTFGAIHRCLEASSVEVTFGVIYLRRHPSSDPAPPRPRLGRSSVV
jgi:hypothetical protein